MRRQVLLLHSDYSTPATERSAINENKKERRAKNKLWKLKQKLIQIHCQAWKRHCLFTSTFLEAFNKTLAIAILQPKKGPRQGMQQCGDSSHLGITSSSEDPLWKWHHYRIQSYGWWENGRTPWAGSSAHITCYSLGASTWGTMSLQQCAMAT